MANLFSPSLARVVDIGKSVVFGDVGAIIELKQALSDARGFVRDFENIFTYLSPSFYRSEESDEFIDFIKQDLTELNKALKDMELVIEKERFIELNPVLYSIEKYAVRISDSVERLTKIKDIDSPESPVPVVNQVIKLAYNVAEGKIKPEELSAQMPVLASFAAYVEAEIIRFEALHKDDGEIIKSAKKLVKDVQQAVGAFVVYFKDQDPAALIDGVRILKFASPPLYLILKKMDLVASASSCFSKIPPLEEFCNAYNFWRKEKISRESFLLALANLDRMVVFYDETLACIKKMHYFYFIEPVYNASSLLTKGFSSFWSSFLKKAHDSSASLDLKELCDKFEKRAADVAKVVEAMELEITKVKSAPYIEEIKELVGRYLSGSLVLEYFSHRLEAFSQNHQALISDFRSKSTGSELVKEACQLLDMQREGIDEMLLFLEDSQKEHLITGIGQIESTLPRLLEIYRGVSPLDKKKKSPLLICPSCSGQYLKGDKVCAKCGAKIPLQISEEELSADGLEQEALPSKLEAIVKLCSKFTAGEISKDKLLNELSAYERLLVQVRKELDSRAKILAKSPRIEIRDCAASFDQNLNLLENAIDSLAGAIENDGDVEGAVSQLRFAGYCLEELRGILRESKRVIK